MQFAKTFCGPSSIVTMIPVGLQVVLQYNQHGVLEKTLVGYGNPLEKTKGNYLQEGHVLDEDTDKNLFKAIASHVPTTISVKGGTTWIYGVMYSDNIPCDDGVLPVALYDSYIKDILNGGHYTFYAGHVYSLASQFQGPLAIRNFLNMSKFNDLPQVVVPVTMSDDTIAAALNPSKYPFNPNYITSFFIYEEMKCRYYSMGLNQITAVRDPYFVINSDGYWVGSIERKDGVSTNFPFAALKHHQVRKGATILVQELAPWNLIILSTRIGNEAELVLSLGEDVKCPVCGKICKVGSSDAAFMCDDPHCMSHQYNQANNMLKVMGLDLMNWDTYRDLVDKKEILCLTDILLLDHYKDADIKMTLAAAMYAVTPFMPFDLLQKFANKCNNKVETVKYYLDNPLRIETDLDIVDPQVARFVEWIEDPYNISTLTTIFDIVEIETTMKKFEGAPIFRGNLFAITGTFKRGDHLEIESILRSYEADVVTSIEPGAKLPDAVITGGLNERISGQMIQKARIHGIPIMEEDVFFTKYEIDQDLAQNLL